MVGLLVDNVEHRMGRGRSSAYLLDLWGGLSFEGESRPTHITPMRMLHGCMAPLSACVHAV